MRALPRPPSHLPTSEVATHSSRLAYTPIRPYTSVSLIARREIHMLSLYTCSHCTAPLPPVDSAQALRHMATAAGFRYRRH